MNTKSFLKNSLLLCVLFLSICIYLIKPNTTYALEMTSRGLTTPPSSSLVITPLPGISVITKANPVLTATTVVLSGTYSVTSLTSTTGNHTFFKWGSSPSYGHTTAYILDDNASDTFTETITGLTPGAAYFYQACMISPTEGLACGDQVTFTTPTNISVLSVSTIGASNITTNTATLNGFYQNTGGPTYTKFIWGTSVTNLSQGSPYISQTGASGGFTYDINGLTPSTTYYFQALAKDSAGIIQQNQILSFRTNDQVTTNCNLVGFWSNHSNNTISYGASAVLSWTPNSHCTSISLSSSDGTYNNYDVTSRTSIDTGTLRNNTSYTLRGTDSIGSAYPLYLTISVGTGGGTTPCQIYSFNISGSTSASVQNGNTANMTWSTSSGCRNLYIAGTNGDYFNNEPNTYNETIGPFYSIYAAHTVYTLHASDSSGTESISTASVTTTSNNGGGGNGGGGYTNGCSIISFYPSSYNLTSGQPVTLNWTTSAGCYNVTLSGGGGTLPYNVYSLPASGSIQTNPLYGTTTFNITANGNVSVTGPSTTVYVAGGYYPYQQNNTGNTNVITIIATNVGAYSAKLNGIVTNTNNATSAYFEYGTAPANLSYKTDSQYFSAGQTMVFGDTIYTNPATTYYYRAIVQINGVIYKGDLMTVITKPVETNTTTYDTTKTTTKSATTSTGVATSTGVLLTIANKADKVYIGDTIDYTVTYANNTNKKLTGVTLNVIFPQGFTVQQSTQGKIMPPSIVTLDIKSLDVGQTGSLFIQAKVENNVSLTNTLVTNGTLTYTYPNKITDSTVGYVLNHAGGISSLGGFSLGAGFFPTTALGWIITILIILAIILTIRRISKSQEQGHGQIHH